MNWWLCCVNAGFKGWHELDHIVHSYGWWFLKWTRKHIILAVGTSNRGSTGLAPYPLAADWKECFWTNTLPQSVWLWDLWHSDWCMWRSRWGFVLHPVSQFCTSHIIFSLDFWIKTGTCTKPEHLHWQNKNVRCVLFYTHCFSFILHQIQSSHRRMSRNLPSSPS